MEVKEKNIVIRYDGNFNSELCRGLIVAAHNQMDSREDDLLIRKKITHIITECLLNLSHHAEQDSTIAGVGKYVEISVEEYDHAYFIRTRNLISTGRIDTLSARLEKINEMSHTELYQHFLNQLQAGQYTNKGTAGLGFIDIARKSGNKLVFDFQPHSSSLSFFNFEIMVHKTFIKT